MTASVYQVAGRDPFWAYRLPDYVPEKYVYHHDQSRIAFDSKLKTVPKHIFKLVVDHYSGKSKNSAIQAYKAKYEISNVRRFNSTRDIFQKATITAGMHY